MNNRSELEKENIEVSTSRRYKVSQKPVYVVSLFSFASMIYGQGRRL